MATTRRSRATLWPSQVLVTLLYTKHPCVARTNGTTLVVSASKFCGLLKLRSPQLRKHLQHLYDIGLLETFTWHWGYFIVTPANPQGYGVVTCHKN